MTLTKRERLTIRALEVVASHLRGILAILEYMSNEDKEEIANKVVTEMQNRVTNVSDAALDDSYYVCSVRNDVDSLMINLLQEQDIRAAMELECCSC